MWNKYYRKSNKIAKIYPTNNKKSRKYNLVNKVENKNRATTIKLHKYTLVNKIDNNNSEENLDGYDYIYENISFTWANITQVQFDGLTLDLLEHNPHPQSIISILKQFNNLKKVYVL